LCAEAARRAWRNIQRGKFQPVYYREGVARRASLWVWLKRHLINVYRDRARKYARRRELTLFAYEERMIDEAEKALEVAVKRRRGETAARDRLGRAKRHLQELKNRHSSGAFNIARHLTGVKTEAPARWEHERCAFVNHATSS